jgi:hypothetical protein
MRKLVAVLALALGMSLAQSYYAGGHVGLFGSSGTNVFNGGIHVGAALGKDLPEVRLGADFTSVLGVLITGINADLLLPLSLSGSQVQPYVGAGGNVWFFGGLTDFGLHATLGGRMAIPGSPLTGFAEIQPGYAFGGGGVFFYYVKLGINYGF